jgi:hypothetical protein
MSAQGEPESELHLADIRTECEPHSSLSLPLSREGAIQATARPAHETNGKPRTGKPKSERRTPDTPHHQAVKGFCDPWELKYGEKYPFNAGKDADAVKWVLSQVGGDIEKFQAVVGRYLADADPFVADKRHPIGMLRAQLPTWIVPGPAGTKPAADTDPKEKQRRQLRNQVSNGTLTREMPRPITGGRYDPRE